MKDPDYPCARCGETLPRREFTDVKRDLDTWRPVHSHCNRCRYESKMEREHPDEVCASCGRHRPLEGQASCRACLAGGGLRVCRGPCAALLASFAFLGRSRICVACARV